MSITNSEIARRLERVAQLLTEQDANFYRIQAYRRAAETIRSLDQPVAELLRYEGEAGLRTLPGIGESLARSIHLLIVSGQLPLLDRLQGESDPVILLASAPGIGATLAERR
jgi:DNA polymerase/3'-5' exonuclease PolX